MLPVTGAVRAAKYWPNDGVTLRARRSRPRRWLSRTVVEAQFEGLVIEILPDARYRVQLDAGYEVLAYTVALLR